MTLQEHEPWRSVIGLVELMHATEGSRSAECGMRNSECGMRNAEFGMRSADERTPQEFKRSEERLAGGSHARDRRESQCGMIFRFL